MNGRQSRDRRAVNVGTAGLLALVVALGACGSSGRHAAPTTTPTTAHTTATTAPLTTVPGIQTSGPRTVLSPIGLNLRAQPVRSAHILGTAAQGAVLNVLQHMAQGGGWFQVKGATHTGWIIDSRTLSAPGLFRSYASAQFTVLYPSTWTASASPPNTVTFRAGTGTESIVVRTATTVAQHRLANRAEIASDSFEPAVDHHLRCVDAPSPKHIRPVLRLPARQARRRKRIAPAKVIPVVNVLTKAHDDHASDRLATD